MIANKSEHKISPRYYMSLDRALKLLPGIKPRKARAMLKETLERLAWNVAMNDGKPFTDVGGRRVTLADLEQVFVEDFSMKVSPAGAALLIDLYKAGALPMVRKSMTPQDAAELATYVSSHAELERKQEAEDAADARWSYLIENPDEVPESEFSLDLLDRIFFRHKGPGPHVMRIGGIEIAKSVVAYSSNNGKSRDYSVSFSWIGTDGTPRELARPSRYEDNRRNDPERNWGLGRE